MILDWKSLHLPPLTNKKFLAMLIVLGLLAMEFSVLPLFINKEGIKDEVIHSFKAATGLDLKIQGDVVLRPFPVPHVIINSLLVYNSPNASSPFLLTVNVIDIRPALKTLFNKNPDLAVVKISGVAVELERMKNDQLNWKDPSLHTVGAEPPAGNTPSLPDITTVSDVAIHYTDAAQDSVLKYEDMDIHFTNNAKQKQSNLDINLNYENVPFAISGTIADLPQALTSGRSSNVALSIKTGKSLLEYEGGLGKDNINGSLKLETDDVVPLVNLLTGNIRKISAADSKPFPLQLKSTIGMEGNKIVLPNLILQGAVVKAGLQMLITESSHIDLKGSMDFLDLETLFASGLFDIKKTEGDAKNDYSETSYSSAKSFWNQITLNADVKLADMLYNTQHITDTHLDCEIANNEITVPQLSALFPGVSRVIFTGIGKQGYQGLAFEGQVDAAGDNFSDMIKIFKPRGFSIPREDFKRFRLKTNAVVSSKDLRLSEITARIENTGIIGGIVATFGQRTRIDAALQIGGVNLDHFITLWGLEDWHTAFMNDSSVEKKEGLLAQWLKELGYDLRLNTSLDQYQLNGALRGKTVFKLEASPGKIAVTDLKTTYNGASLAGNVTIDITKPLPFVDVDAALDTLDAQQFLNVKNTPDPTPPGQPKERWSHKTFDVRWMDILSASYHLRLGHFRNGDFQAQNVDVSGNLNERVLNVTSLNADMMGMHVSGKGSLAGGKIPSAAMSVDVSSIDPEQLYGFLPVLQGMTGKYNANMRLNTNGIDIASWVSNLEGVIGVSGRDIIVQGFNLPGIIRAVSYVRTVADILDVVKRAFPGGSTLFTNVSGQWSIVAGTFKAPNITLTNDQTDGVLTAEVDMVNWKTQGHVTFGLKSLDAAHPPGMTVNFSGNFDAPEKALDTRSLEQYVTNKTSEKMLQQYGTH